MSSSPSIVWFRQDLRTDDHPALEAAIQKGGPIIPVYIWAPEEEGEWAPGAASRWWLHYSLEQLKEELKELGLALIIRQHASLQTLINLVQETGADTIYWNRRYEPLMIQRDAFIKAEMQNHHVRVQSFNSHLLFEPWIVSNKQGKPFQVFTPFWKKCLSLESPAPPIAALKKCPSYLKSLDSERIEALGLLPKIPWDEGFKAKWRPGSKGAKERLLHVLKTVISHYDTQRDQLDLDGVSRLSPHLHYGELSPRQVWHAALKQFGWENEGCAAFLRQLGWREFAHHLLYYFPHTPTEPLRTSFSAFPWQDHHPHLRAWQKGLTGYPVVDAGMRQLWATGWMHNRARLITASFLVKDLLIHWHEGAKWFWDTLVDADLANNTMGWQWIAGCGADAAPYFRIFNPVSQGEKFDQVGQYVRDWVPELRALPDKWIHCPWEAPDDILRSAGLILGVHYPKPIIDHQQARERALEAYAKL